MSAQPGLPVNKWLNHESSVFNDEILSTINYLPEDPIISRILPDGEIGISGSSFYWTDSGWNELHEPGISGMFVKRLNNGILVFGDLNAAVGNSSDVFTDSGWIKVQHRISVSSKSDKLFYDESKNRFILLRRNVPWVYYPAEKLQD
ncbi:MAG: hypothetical protein JW995_11825 [Melioribacteraceae bacterium]|nr:hypothetical protein [Melioribacteraceae bacterium]